MNSQDNCSSYFLYEHGFSDNFIRIKVQYPPQKPRGGHTCNAIGGGQIISIGGFEANSTIHTGLYEDIWATMFNSTDPFAQGLGVFNMTSLAWEDHYTANAPAYVQSDLIRTFYADKYVLPPVVHNGTDLSLLVPKMAPNFQPVSSGSFFKQQILLLWKPLDRTAQMFAHLIHQAIRLAPSLVEWLGVLQSSPLLPASSSTSTNAPSGEAQQSNIYIPTMMSQIQHLALNGRCICSLKLIQGHRSRWRS